MANDPSEEKHQKNDPPTPEVLKPQADSESEQHEQSSSAQASLDDAKKPERKLRRGSYRPSHKATFIGLAVIVAILAVNAVAITLVIKNQDKSDQKNNQEEVVISADTLNGLGVNRTPIGDEGVELLVGPDSRFRGKVQVGGDVSIAGQLQLNSKFSAAQASLAQLEAGNTSLAQLNVNGDSTASNLALRNNLTVNGQTRLQGAVTVTQLLTVNNSVNVAGNLAVGGTLSVGNFQANNIVSGSNITIGGHFVTRGAAPSVRAGGAVGSNGTVSISGSDVAGTVAVNTGVGAGNGIVANVSFRTRYGNTPRVVVTPVGYGVRGYVYINRTASGFSIGVDGPITAGGHAFDYFVIE